MLVCSVCSRFRSSSFFRLFPFKGSAYTAYKRIQNQSETRLNPTPIWVYATCARLMRQLHTGKGAASPACSDHGRTSGDDQPGLVGSSFRHLHIPGEQNPQTFAFRLAGFSRTERHIDNLVQILVSLAQVGGHEVRIIQVGQ